MSSEDEAAPKVAKKHKPKKQKSKPEDTVVAAAAAEVEDHVPASVEEAEPDEKQKKKKDKKRKREAIPEELEIDVSLPEPLSKKERRKAKKAKTTEGQGESETSPATNGEASVERRAPSGAKAGGGALKEEHKERRTEHSIWIGNLPWTATRQDLRDFLCDQASIRPSQIVRLHMPAPDKKVALDTRGRPPFANRGFAYVDFDGPEALFAALQLTETPFYRSGRNVLIKDAKSFEGRPEEHTAAAAAAAGSTTAVGSKAKGPAGNPQKPPSKRVFVGNLAFEITKEDLEQHFAQCGPVENVHMATFEDSGKCKGYAWVTFATLEAAEAAVRGWIFKEPEDGDENEVNGDDHADDADVKAKSKKKGRKWFVNRLLGREIKREYAEDASVRYKKRFGGAEKRRQDLTDAPITEVADGSSNAQATLRSSHDRRREQRKAQKPKVDARTVAPGAALARAQRTTGAITEAKGTKITFD
ncbi:uncharacterized protein PV09_01506 [Verruconis gallopava]|uniref:RRM domain-containing protein n=1 Tax=Verruconis gallopava TaxID=253628 RepID=A0A0D1Z3M9_9PEZI|nr:uncharacterized protein PV09_01506 [Verruconis gallopava]KIW07547.1 hypothetical protein PV09_01506 [Verruconis gallopava]